MATAFEASPPPATGGMLIVAVEPSADVIGARLMTALRDRLPGVRFIGVGGPRMREAGLDGLFNVGPLSVLGLTEGLRAFPQVLRRAAELARLAQRERPLAAVLIDAWGFNLRVARRLKQLAEPPLIIKYVGPQVWATRPGRARALAKAVDRLLAIHVFDAPYFEKTGLPVDFVGNPALPAADAGAYSHQRDERTVLLLPGSRPAEIRRLAEVFGNTARRLRAGQPDVRFVLAPAEAVADLVTAAARTWSLPVEIVRGEAERRAAMERATVALACSGTITTELAAAGCPMVVAYRVSALTGMVGRLLIRTPWITLVNIAAGKTIAPEFIQGRCTADKLAAALRERLDNSALRARQIADQTRALEIMRGGIADPIAAAADAVIRALTCRSAPAAHPRISTGV